MKKRALIKKVKKLIESTLIDVNIVIDVKHKRTRVNMVYDFIQGTLIFDAKRMVEARNEMMEKVSLEDYIKALTLHELGHHLDRYALIASLPRTYEIYELKQKIPYSERRKNLSLFKVDLEEHEMDYAFEESAWAYAKKLNRLYNLVNDNVFEKVKFNSMLSYLASYNQDLLIYQQLLLESETSLAG
ncbi:hypothetical protein [Halalkalibacterium ligniniphilum]|uniref:hypothetical protein n=1 Tax=Halalkalibacterium ligniniphilum TaxID=1134413 RepID=UPI00034A15F9|nr:hypothetical protein [Halalkalibacterium ligniniphilum]